MTDRRFKGFIPEGATAFSLEHIDYQAAFHAYARRLAGHEIEVEIRRFTEKRSDRQNRSYHAMLTPWALSEGHNIEDLKDDCLREVFGEREVVNVLTGEVRKALVEPHTSKLNRVQFAELMERTVEIAAGCGVILELPSEFKARTRAA